MLNTFKKMVGEKYVNDIIDMLGLTCLDMANLYY